MTYEIISKYAGKALMLVRPNSTWQIIGAHQYADITWLDEVASKPTEQEFLDGVQMAYNIDLATTYVTQRAREYPPITDYIDGVVKGDQEQIQDYIDKCLEVKAKYPKPE